jgi:TonB family protein
VRPNQVCLVGCLLLATLSSARDKQKDAEALLKRAQEATDIRSDSSKPFRLRVRFHFAGELSSERAEVEYEETWRSADQWRREIRSPEFEQVEVGGKDKRWVLHDLAAEPARMRYIREWAQISGFEAGEVALLTSAEGGGTGHCLTSYLKGIEQTLCFDPATGLLTHRKLGTEPGAMSCDYGDYKKFGEKTYPRTLSCSATLGFTIDGVVTDLAEDDSSDDATRFAPLTGAREWPVCSWISPPRWLHSWGPTPWSLRAPLAKGVGVSFTVEVDGKPANITTVKSVGKHSDVAAVGIVKGWKFKPATCSGATIPYPFEVVFH